MLVTLVALLNLVAFAQQPDKLEQKNGVLSYKLGQPYKSYSTSLEFDRKEKDVSYYKNVASSPSSIFSEKWDSFFLGFYKDKLYCIQVDFFIDDLTKEETFVENYKTLFGYATELTEGGFGAEWGYHWESKSVTLQLTKGLNSSVDPTLRKRIVLYMVSKPIQKQILDDQF